MSPFMSTGTPSETEQAIRDKAGSPQSVTADGVTVTQRNLRDQVAADQYLDRKTAARSGSPIPGARMVKLMPGGPA